MCRDIRAFAQRLNHKQRLYPAELNTLPTRIADRNNPKHNVPHRPSYNLATVHLA